LFEKKKYHQLHGLGAYLLWLEETLKLLQHTSWLARFVSERWKKAGAVKTEISIFYEWFGNKKHFSIRTTKVHFLVLSHW